MSRTPDEIVNIHFPKDAPKADFLQDLKEAYPNAWSAVITTSWVEDDMPPSTDDSCPCGCHVMGVGVAAGHYCDCYFAD